MRRFLLGLLALALLLTGCGSPAPEQSASGWVSRGSMPLRYATGFRVDYYDGGYKLITLRDGSTFLTVPEGAALPEGAPRDAVILQQPIRNIYLAATSAMCLFDALNRLDAIAFSGSRAENWYIENARKAMEAGDILYAGKYSEPDYELLLAGGCPLAVESMMIGHSSDVKKKLEELGIGVFTDQSSMEEHPLGRTEWIKLYGALLDEEALAETLFDQQAAYLEELEGEDIPSKTLAFFHISSSGYVVARKSGDYVTKMLELAGGEYVFRDLGDPETRTSTVTIEMEQFFASAKDADIIIYNSTIGGEIQSLEELLEKSPLLAQFRAVQTGNVWCTQKNMYQETTQLGQMIQSFRKIISGEAQDMTQLPFLYRLK